MPSEHQRGQRRRVILREIKREFAEIDSEHTGDRASPSIAVLHHQDCVYSDDHPVVQSIVPLGRGRQARRIKREFMINRHRLTCSLDFLAAVAGYQAQYETFAQCQSEDAYEPRTNNTDDDNDGDSCSDDTCSYLYSDVVGYADDLDRHEDHEDHEEDDSDRGFFGVAIHNHQVSPEEDAAAALLMAGLVRSCPKPRRRCRANACEFDQSISISKRLSQNQLYRKRLLDKGVYPIKHDSKQYSCSLCEEVFEKEMFVWRHGVKHLETKPFLCSLCGGRFNRSDSLHRHMRNFHNEG